MIRLHCLFHENTLLLELLLVPPSRSWKSLTLKLWQHAIWRSPFLSWPLLVVGSLSSPLSVLMLTFCSGQVKKFSWFKPLVVSEPFTWPYPAPTPQVAVLLDSRISLFLTELSPLPLPSILICIPSSLRASPFTQSLARSPQVVLDSFTHISHQTLATNLTPECSLNQCHLIYYFFFFFFFSQREASKI